MNPPINMAQADHLGPEWQGQGQALSSLSLLNVPLVGPRFVAFDENRFFGESPPLVARHVNHHGDPVHYASTGDFPGKRPAALHGTTGDPG